MKTVNNIFLVDDDEIFTYLTKKTIESTTLVNQIKVFSNGQEAIDFLESIASNVPLLPDIIFLDLSMPVLDGWGFLEEYVKLKPSLGKEIVIYIITSSVTPKDILRAKSISEVSDFLVKPVSKEKFIELLKHLI